MAVWPNAMQLYGLTVAAAPAGEEGIFTTAGAVREPPDEQLLPAGSSLRVDLYWEVLHEMDQNYTVFVHALNSEGTILGQHDGWPADAHRPTSVLPAGEVFRDVHYLTLSEPPMLSDITLDGIELRIGLYESLDGEILQDSSQQDYVEIPIR